MMHALQKTIRQIDMTHKGIGAMIAMNIVCAKAKMCILNIAPAGCGKSVSTDAVTGMLGQVAQRYTSLTLAGMKHEMDELTQFNGHMLIDDLGGEKSEWSRFSTVTVLANLIYGHYIKKVTYAGVIEIANFYGSASLNIQPILMQSIVGENDWISVIRDKVLRYYHLIRPIHPKTYLSNPTIDYSVPMQEVSLPKYSGKLWYQLIAIGLTQWSYGRILEYLPKLLKACAALDGRTHVAQEDYRLLIKLMKPMQLERYIVTSYGFESGRAFENNTYCILVELASHGQPTIDTICEDYKVSPETVIRLAQSSPAWCWIQQNSPKKICPTEQADTILKLAGVNQKW
jgi:hypothetical protein